MSFKTFKLLWERKACPFDVHQRDSKSRSLLHLAILTEDNDIMELLMGDYPNQDVNTQDANGETPLHYACKTQNKVAVDSLLKLRSNKDNRNFGFETELRTRGGETPLFVAIKTGHVSIVRRLLWSGCNPFTFNNLGQQAFT